MRAYSGVSGIDNATVTAETLVVNAGREAEPFMIDETWILPYLLYVCAGARGHRDKLVTLPDTVILVLLSMGRCC